MADEAREVPSRNVRRDRRRIASEGQQDRRKQRLAIILSSFFILIIVGSIMAAFMIEFVFPSKQLVVSVDDVKYTRGEMVKLLRARQQSFEFFGQQFSPTTDIFEALNTLVEDEIIALSAPRFGITVSDEEIDADVFRFVSLGANGAEGGEPGRLDAQSQEVYRSYLNTIQIRESDDRERRRKTLLRGKLRQFLGDSIPTVAEQVHLHRVVVLPEDEVDIMLVKFRDAAADSKDPEKLQEAFKRITREFSRDSPETIRRGGDLGWVATGIFPNYDDAFFNLEVGKLSAPTPNVDEANEILFFMVSERAQARELNPQNREVLKTRALQDWLNEERDNHDIQADFNSEIYAWFIDQLSLTASITPTPQPNPLGF